MFTRIKSSLAAKISILFLVMVVLSSVAVGLSSYLFYRNDSIDSNAQRARSIAQAVAASVDGDQFAAMLAEGEKTPYWDDVKRTADDTLLDTGLAYLYLLDANIIDTVTYFAEGYDPATATSEEMGFGATEGLVVDGEQVYAQEMLDTIASGQPSTTDLYDSGEYGTMVSGFAAITNSAGQVVGVVGADLGVDDVLATTASFGLRIILIVAGFCVVSGIVSVLYVRRLIGRPVAALRAASDQMAAGDLDVRLDTSRSDELGRLAASFQAMTETTRRQADTLEALADGNLDVQVQARSDKDLMSHSMMKMLDNLNAMFMDIQGSSRQVSQGADQIAQGSQTLATGATEQAATLQQSAAAINEVLQQSEENTQRATDAYNGTMRAGELMAQSMEAMGRMEESMQQINDSSVNISKVIKVVDDIAFQTNILALNAAVEAARAGQHGKGFAVVADEVRNLAAKSAAAAQETESLVAQSIQRVKEGSAVTEETKETLLSVNEISAANAVMINEINDASRRQSDAIAQINQGIGDLSGVVQANSATAEQSAASAEEMSSQAQMLNAIVGRFHLRSDALPPGQGHPLLRG